MIGEIKIHENLNHLNSRWKITFWHTNPSVMSERAAYILNKYPGVLGKAIRELKKK